MRLPRFAQMRYLSRRKIGGVAMLRRSFVDDERTVHLCEDGLLNLSVKW